MAPGWLRRWAEAWLLAVLALALEAVGVFVVARTEFAAGYELTLALQTLLPLAALLALPAAAFGAVLVSALERAESSRGRATVAALAAAWVGAVAAASSSGRLLAGARRPAFVLVGLAIGGLVGFALARPLGRVCRRAAASRGVMLALALGVFALLEWSNQRVLPKLYPGFHVGLAVLSVAVASLAGLRAEGSDDARSRRVPPLGVSGLVLLLVGVAAAVAPKRLRLQDNVRWIYLEHAPLLGHGVELAARVVPPPPLDDEPAFADTPRASQALDFGGRDVLLVTIDALRADHVGAYGYGRKTTPRIDALAREGAVFDAAYTATPHTSYAVASLMTGKYMRPLLLQGLGADSDTLAGALRRYDVRTAAFYPPAVFFVDRERFVSFEESSFGFEYKKEQFAEASERASQLEAYLATRGPGERLFVWVHLFEPHEPYVAHPDHPFGEHAMDRYDSEVAAADAGFGAIVDVMRRARPETVVLVTADHGEEFGDHGGRYHGTSVYDEQVRVPLVVHAPGLVPPSRVSTPVGLVDVMPTILGGAGIPVSPRVRGRDLGPWLSGKGGEGVAFSETEEHTLFARGASRLLCARKVGACRLFDVAADPRELQDVSATHTADAAALKEEGRRLVASLGRFEAGADVSWPHALRRGLAGDVDAASDVAALLGDADVRIRRKAAETLFELAYVDGSSGASETSKLGVDVSEPLRRALASDEDETVRRHAAIALTRLGQGAPLAFDLVRGNDRDWQRLAALALAEGGDDRGLDVLLAWWNAAFPSEPNAHPEPLLFERGKQLAAAFAKLKRDEAVLPLSRGLDDVRLRRFVARALATIGKDTARPALAAALAVEPYHDARSVLARAIVDLGGRAELVAPLARFLGVPDPMPDALLLAEKADVLAWVGGPNSDEVGRLRRFATSGVVVGVVVPEGGNGQGCRVVVRAHTKDGAPGEVRVGVKAGPRAVEDRTRDVPKAAPKVDPDRTVTLTVAGREGVEVASELPKTVTVASKDAVDLVVYATQNVEVESLALVPLADEPVPPKRER